jgi:transcriptional activator for dhaKLM operon
MDEESLELLERYPWPGNVRELESVIERAILHSRDNVVRPLDLPENVRTIRALEPQRTTTSAVLTILEAEREAIVRAGWACQGVISAMADALGINRSTLWRKMNQYGINADDFK